VNKIVADYEAIFHKETTNFPATCKVEFWITEKRKEINNLIIRRDWWP